jgi:hypothetical protein
MVEAVRDDIRDYPVAQLDAVLVPLGELDELVLRRPVGEPVVIYRYRLKSASRRDQEPGSHWLRY